MKKLLNSTFFILWGLMMTGCGVKAPPQFAIIPEKPKIPALQCSVYDLKCPRTDPNYLPGLDEKKDDAYR